MKKKYELFAFWKYDLFPFLLCAPINTEDMRDDGMVAPPSYAGYLFRPVKITTFEHGQKLESELNALQTEKQKELSVIEYKYKQKLDAFKSYCNFPKE